MGSIPGQGTEIPQATLCRKGPFLKDMLENRSKFWLLGFWSSVREENWWRFRLQHMYIDLISSSQPWLTSPEQRASVILSQENTPLWGAGEGQSPPSVKSKGGLELQLLHNTVISLFSANIYFQSNLTVPGLEPLETSGM